MATNSKNKWLLDEAKVKHVKAVEETKHKVNIDYNMKNTIKNNKKDAAMCYGLTPSRTLLEPQRKNICW